MTLPKWKLWVTAGAIGSAAMLGAAGKALALGEGDRAPSFSVQSTTGKPISLNDFLGKKSVVVFFYYACFTNT